MSTSEMRLCLFDRKKLFNAFTDALRTVDSSSLVTNGFFTAMRPFLDRLGKKIRPEASGRSSYCY